MRWSGATPRRSSRSGASRRRPARRRSSSPATSPSLRNASRPRRRPHRTYGRIDILVNVAGGSGPIGKSGVETTPQEFDDIVTLNMNGCFHTMRGVLPTMMAQRYGKIVNVGGTFGMRGRAGRMAYSASKWGLRGITKSFALEVGAYNINVNCVAPGHGRRSALPRQGLRRHGDASRHHRRGGRRAACRRLRAQAGHRAMSTSPMPACSLPAMHRARSPAIDLPVDGGWAML